MSRTLEKTPYWSTKCSNCGHPRYDHDTHEKKCWSSYLQNNRCECKGFKPEKVSKTKKVKPDIHHIVNKPFGSSTKLHPWKNNRLQFARLIAELEASGVFAKKGVMKDLQESMDLDEDQILELVERASNDWDATKAAICPPGRV